MSKRITISDVAKEAGVSMMTVSRAINNKGGISEETRQRILKLADEMGFQPSGLAQGLATKRTATIGLVVPDIANPFFALIARGIENVAYDNGYNVFLLNTDEDREREAAALNSLWQKQVDGLILCSSRLEQTELNGWLQRFPYVVLVNRVLETAVSGVCTINIDDRDGAKQIMDYFIGAGHQNIAFVAGPAHSRSGQERLLGYQMSLQNHNLPMRSELIHHCVPDTDGGYDAALTLLQKDCEITAVFAYNDLTATGVLRACLKQERQVPKDIEIIGADDIPLASLVTPTLSTLRIAKRELGVAAMQTLVQLMKSEAESENQQQIIKPTLILRGTTTSTN